MEKLVSVIVPIYNVKKYLTDCIDSIIGQTYANIEIILVDDGSEDGCAEICDAYKEKDSRIKVIHKENGGLSSARNAGIEMALGSYLAFVDSDDTIHEFFIETLYNMCETYDCDIAQCDFLQISEKSIKLAPQKWERLDVCSPIDAIRRSCFGLEVIKYTISWNKIYKRTVFEGVRFPEGKIHEDMFVAHRLYRNANKIITTNKYLYYYLQRKDSITGLDYDRKRILDNVEATRVKMLFFKENHLEEDYLDMLNDHFWNIRKAQGIIMRNEPKEETVLSELKEEELCLKKLIMQSMGKNLLGRIKDIYTILDEEEQKKCRDFFGRRVEQIYRSYFEFPFYRIKKDTKVALYGAGLVGKEYAKQIKEKGVGEVVLWVDNAWKNYVKEGYDVKPIDSLLYAEYDCIIVAVRSNVVADEIIHNLIGWGIDESKIFYDVPLDGQGIRERFLADIQKIPHTENRKWFLMNTPDHGNMGDHAIAFSALDFLRDYFAEDEIVEITGWQWDAFKHNIIQKVETNDVIAIVGGGFMGDLWPVQDERVKDIVNAFPGNKIVFLPQTFYYTREESIVSRDKEFYEQNKNIFFIHREKNSFEFFSKHVVSNEKRNACYPDLVLYDKKEKKQKIRNGVIVCLRLDKEMVSYGVRRKLLDLCKKLGVQVEFMDTVLDKNVQKHLRAAELEQMIEKISGAKLFITDRLHGMLLATVTGTPCIAFDNLSKKVSGVYEWIKNLDYVVCIEEEELEESLLLEFLGKTKNVYSVDFLKAHFDEMAKDIKKWIEG